jgi:hypothetical protein
VLVVQASAAGDVCCCGFRAGGRNTAAHTSAPCPGAVGGTSSGWNLQNLLRGVRFVAGAPVPGVRVTAGPVKAEGRNVARELHYPLDQACVLAGWRDACSRGQWRDFADPVSQL